MFVFGINNIGFKGQTKYLSCDANGNYKKIAEYQYGSKYFGDTRGLSDFILRHSYPYAGVEETIGKVHNDKTYKVYIADPNEVVANSIKHSHDYIVYDKEPNFAAVIKGYFNQNPSNLDKEFQTLLDYYKRLENSAVIKQDEELAKARLELVTNCKKIFDESAFLREERDNLVFKINKKSYMIELIKSNVEDFSRKLGVKINTIETYKRSYDAKDRKLSNLHDKKSALLSSKKVNSQKIDDVDKNIKILTELKDALGVKIRNYEAKIKFWENYIINAPKKITECSNDIVKMKNRLNEIEAELKPNYEKLCRFYTMNGIKIIKRV